MNYDRWLEKPYQDAYAAGEAFEEFKERLEQESDFEPCDNCEWSRIQAPEYGAAVFSVEACEGCVENYIEELREEAAERQAGV